MGEQVGARSKEKNRQGPDQIERALEREPCRKQGGKRRGLRSPVPTQYSREELIEIKLVLPVIRVYKGVYKF